MFLVGLVSVSFRTLSCTEIISMAKIAGIEGIEWGGDVHVAHGNIQKAISVRKMMEENALETYAYGSYYRVGIDNDFDKVLETALALGTKNIRIWAGKKNYENINKIEKMNFITDLRTIAKKASEKNMILSFEYHENTLCNGIIGIKYIIKNTREYDNIYFNWQPLDKVLLKEKMKSLSYVKNSNKLKIIHVFHWKIIRGKQKRFKLKKGRSIWKKYLKGLRDAKKDVWLSLEFFKDDSEVNFFEDVKTLKKLL